MKKIVTMFVLVIWIAIGWLGTASSMQEVDYSDTIRNYLKIAEEQKGMNAYGTAIRCYQKIIEIEDTLEHNMMLVETYKEAGKYGNYKDALETVIGKFPNDKEAYEILAGYYHGIPNYTECVDVCKRAFAAGVNTDYLTELYYDSAFRFQMIGSGFMEAHCFYNGIAMVKKGEVSGYIDGKGNWVEPTYQDAKSGHGSLMAIKQDDKVFFVNQKGEKFLDKVEIFDDAWSFQEGRAAVVIQGKYNYISETSEIVLGEYDYATTFSSGLAAVKSGELWRVMDRGGAFVSDKKFTDVLMDEDNVCSNQGVVFVSEGDGYFLINSKGETVSDLLFEDARPFFDSPLTAVKKDDKWGFIDTKGNMVIKPEYEDARAFGMKLAAVKINGLWGFINTSNRVVIEPQFEDAKCFSEQTRSAPVLTNGIWSYIRLVVEEKTSLF